MPALTFGLKAKPGPGSAPKITPGAKRKAMFDNDDEDEPASSPPPQSGPGRPSRPLKPIQPLKDDTSDSEDNSNNNGTSSRPRKSPKLTQPPAPSYGLQKKPTSNTTAIPTTDKDYTNLSALRTANLHATEASKLDSTAYDYDAVYDTFKPSKPTSSSTNTEPTQPKYMTSLLASTTQRKRDHERAREKALQREREQEGDEFAGKEAFVTSAYKQQQEENRLAEAEEARKVEEEEERKRKGMGGMVGFNKMMLEREEERRRAIEEAEEARRKASVNGNGYGGGSQGVEVADDGPIPAQQDEDDAQNKEAQKRGAILNEEGEVIDKRQLLSAGLNVAPKKPGTSATSSTTKDKKAPAYQPPRVSADARLSQRERQSRLIAAQMEAQAEAAAAEEAKAAAAVEEKAKSKITEEAKMGAKERYLARKREAEEAKKKGG
ncbi:uncharacterized protein AB675_5050 [Cyphellophora attinorum]|uniref:Nuclear speckle splicing regulatory protein 1 N-terminal domain-containing protein n=1 Tax=Cyphellophora attinorum TaxID=1664694 RepID=A0A0N1HA10_9EURO|nr:uncharacterized protein AB675_5050 [Phialophora attinorum]KPI39233.1 hypothetical protein AB675_5050 [Phialophora attinorum]